MTVLRTAFFLCLLPFLVPYPATGTDLESDLATELERLRRRFRLNRAIGVQVQDLESGEVLYAHNATKKFIPASGMKLVTMAAALHYLGPSYRFETRFLAGGSFEDGVVGGDLYVVGSGDPSFAEGDMETVASVLAEAGLRRIEGNLVLDDSFFDDRLRGPASYDNILKKGLPIQSALSYNFNIVELRASPAEPGTRASLHDSGYGYFEVVNRVQTASRGRPWLRVRKVRSNRVVLSGRVIAGDEEARGGFVAPDPPAFFAHALLGKLAERGIELRGRVLKGEARGRPLELLHTHRSPTLSQLVELTGKDSNNFVAEQILKALGAHRFGPPGSFASGSKTLAEYLVGLGFDRDDFEIEDGSGLSYENRLSTEILVSVLKELFRAPEIRADFLCSLSVAGVDGTLRRRFRNERYFGRVVAKTGSLAGVSSLSGFVFVPGRDPVVFSVMLQGIKSQWTADHVEDEVAKAIFNRFGI